MLGITNHRGVSLIELLAGIAIIAVLSIIAIPSFFRYLQMNNVAETAQKLYYNLQYARSEAIKRNTLVYVVFQTGTNWCYGMNAGATCNCSTANSCGLGSVNATNADYASLTLTNISSNSFTFEGTHGASFLNNGLVTFTVSGGGSSAISVKISPLGDVLLCSANVSGYQTCS